MVHERPILDTLDHLLMVAGGVLLIAGAWRWRRAGGRDPLRGSPIRANRLTPLLVWLCFMAYALGGAVGHGVAGRLTPAGMGGREAEAWQGVLAASTTQVLVVLTCLAVAHQTFAAGLAGLGLALRAPRAVAIRRVLVGWLASLAACGLAAWGVQVMIRWLWEGYRPPEHGVFTTLDSPHATAAMRLLAIASAAALAPLGEECLFRGIIQTALRKLFVPRPRSLYHRWAAIALAATGFGLMHAGTPQFVPALIVLGVILGALYERTGSLWTPIAVHLLFNAKSLLWYHL